MVFLIATIIVLVASLFRTHSKLKCALKEMSEYKTLVNNQKAIELQKFAQDLFEARKEITLQDLTDQQWCRVCNRIALCIHKQVFPFDWDAFMKEAGCPEDREVA